MDASIIAWAGGLLWSLAMLWLAGPVARWAGRGLPVPDEARRIGCIDGLRGYLALMVAISHFWSWNWMAVYRLPWASRLPHIVQNGGHGPVVIFFMITGLLFYARVRDGVGGVDWRGLLVSRLFRIYPLALISISLVLACLWVDRGFPTDPAMLARTGRGLARWLVFMASAPLFDVARPYIVNAGIFWTLGYEWLFYLTVLPAIAIARSLTRGWLPRWTTPLWCVAIGGAYKLAGSPFAPFLLPFMVGMIVVELREIAVVRRALARTDVGLVALGIALAAMAFLPSPAGGRTIATALLYAPVFACVACGQSYRGMLTSRGALLLGEASFGIYLLHGIVLWLLFRNLGIGRGDDVTLLAATVLPAAIIVTAGTATIAFRRIEQPAIAAGRRLRHRLARKSAPTLVA